MKTSGTFRFVGLVAAAFGMSALAGPAARADLYTDVVEHSLASLHSDENTVGAGAGVEISSARAGVGKVLRFNLLVGTRYNEVSHGCGNDDLTIERKYAFEVSGT